MLRGTRSHAQGRVLVGGRPGAERDVAGRIRRGLALIPEDRKRDRLVQIMAIRENLTPSSLRDMARRGRLDLRAEARRALDFAKRLAVEAASLELPVSSLSGGNQQKVVIGKALMTKPCVLLMDEPSRGIEVAPRPRCSASCEGSPPRGSASSS